MSHATTAAHPLIVHRICCKEKLRQIRNLKHEPGIGGDRSAMTAQILRPEHLTVRRQRRTRSEDRALRKKSIRRIRSAICDRAAPSQSASSSQSQQPVRLAAADRNPRAGTGRVRRQSVWSKRVVRGRNGEPGEGERPGPDEETGSPGDIERLRHVRPGSDSGV